MQAFELKVQAALGFFNLSANSLIIHAASERISSLASDDQMALPSVDFLNPLPCAYLCGFSYFYALLKRAAASRATALYFYIYLSSIPMPRPLSLSDVSCGLIGRLKNSSALSSGWWSFAISFISVESCSG